MFTENEATELETSTSHNDSTTSGTPHRTANHVLINEYPPGCGIMPHEDGAAYAPVVATITLGSHCVLDLYEKHDSLETGTDAPDAVSASLSPSPHEKRPRYRILQEPRSLLVTRGPAYSSLIHGIADVHEDADLNAHSIMNWGLLGDPAVYASGAKARELRISLTYRDVVKVSNVGGRLFGKPRT